MTADATEPDKPLEPDGVGDAAERRTRSDQSCRQVVTLWYASAVFWLLFGSLLALIASIKLHTPGFLDNAAWLTFGRVRPAHLNTVTYGWASMAGVGTMLWLMARLNRVRLPWPQGLYLVGLWWNALVLAGTVNILAGNGTSIEWLEFPWWVSIPLGVFFFVLTAVALKMLRDRRQEHLYVSQWYLLGATLWFPVLYIAATLMIHTPLVSGVVKSAANWWFAHNVLGLWLTPIGLASAYYFIPKVIGRPIHSYYLSILGFWTLALFYNWAGTHHLVGGPVPAWLVTVGIVGSMMMIVPVAVVAVNHHFTMVGHFSALRTSPTLRFVVFGAMAYTLVSVQGALTALRSVNETTHFTHYTIAHAHLGVYAFYSMIMFGGFYYVMPRLVNREWISSGLIKVHFWCSAVGVSLYWIGLTWGGWIQGQMLNDPNIPFLNVVADVVPFLVSRSVAGVLMTVGHVAFAISVWKMVRRDGEWLTGPTLFTSRRSLRRARQAGGDS